MIDCLPTAEPLRYRDHAGDERIRNRRQAWQLYGRIYCPYQHRISGAIYSLEEDTYQCAHKAGNGTPVCNALLYALVDVRTRDGEQLVWTVEITKNEIAKIRRMPIGEKLQYLGVTWKV